MDFSGLVAELSQALHHEADYVRERAFLDCFAAALEGDDRSSRAALGGGALLRARADDELGGGDTARVVVARGPRLAHREALGRAMLDLFCLELFAWGMVQTDPNYGNFVRECAGRRRAWCCSTSEPRWSSTRSVYVPQHASRDCVGRTPRMVEEGIAFGGSSIGEGPEARELFVEMLRNAFEPFEPRRQPFVFRDEEHAAIARNRAAVHDRALCPTRRRRGSSSFCTASSAGCSSSCGGSTSRSTFAPTGRVSSTKPEAFRIGLESRFRKIDIEKIIIKSKAAAGPNYMRRLRPTEPNPEVHSR